MEYLLLLFLFVVVLGLVFFYLFQEKFIFKTKEKIARNKSFAFKNPFNEVFIQTKDHQELNAVHFTLPAPKGIVLFCHGNKGSIADWGDRVSYFLDYNYEVFLYDYRGYGKSTGSFNEEKMYQDALLVYNYVKKSFTPATITVYGYSLGATFATKIASVYNPQQLILEAPFYNLTKAAQKFLPFSPTFLLKYRFNSAKYIALVKCPVAIFHGDLDATTSFEEAKQLLQLNTHNHHIFVAIKGGNHHNLPSFSLYQQKLTALLER